MLDADAVYTCNFRLCDSYLREVLDPYAAYTCNFRSHGSDSDFARLRGRTHASFPHLSSTHSHASPPRILTPLLHAFSRLSPTHSHLSCPHFDLSPLRHGLCGPLF